ncbi:DUF3883 domain-containing protein [Ferrimonas sp.]|uniref:DUF3883 domain-containing protein n=1 Tax=Ferrimonas sp. TaxID=2080861 RepID=UPI003A8CAC13
MEEIQLKLRPPLISTYKPLLPLPENVHLKEQDVPSSSSFRNNLPPSTVSAPNWAQIQEHNRELGLRGEELVLKHEKKLLQDAGRNDLADRVEHIALTDSAAGYDLLSFDDKGQPKYIEVKTTRKSSQTPFYISSNEVERSKKYGQSYWIYRLFNYGSNSEEICFFKLRGPADESLMLEANSYKAIAKNKN